jgi:hypothetical protein
MKTASIYVRIGQTAISGEILVGHFKILYPSQRQVPGESSLQLYSAEDGHVYLDFYTMTHNKVELVVSTGATPIASIDYLLDHAERVYNELATYLRTSSLKPKDMYIEVNINIDGQKECILRARPEAWQDIITRTFKKDIAPKVLTLVAIILVARISSPSSSDPWLGPFAAAAGAIAYTLGMVVFHFIRRNPILHYKLPGRERAIED